MPSIVDLRSVPHAEGSGHVGRSPEALADAAEREAVCEVWLMALAASLHKSVAAQLACDGDAGHLQRARRDAASRVHARTAENCRFDRLALCATEAAAQSTSALHDLH